ncbi:MAG: two-component system phosphate regulon response regulator PhoB, partial [Porticoccus sp.]
MSKKTILVVDDEPAIRDMINTALYAAGFYCLQAESAQQA